MLWLWVFAWRTCVRRKYSHLTSGTLCVVLFGWCHSVFWRMGDDRTQFSVGAEKVRLRSRGLGLEITDHPIDRLVQDCSNSIALAMELLQSCTKPSTLSNSLINDVYPATSARRHVLISPAYRNSAITYWVLCYWVPYWDYLSKCLELIAV